MGQLSKYRTTLERAPDDPKFGVKLQEAKGRLAGKPVSEIGNLYCTLRYKKARLEQRIKEYNVEIEACVKLMVDYLETSNLEKIKLNNGHGTSLSLKDDVYTSVKDKGSWMNYIHENELENLLSVHPSTLKSLVVSMLDEGKTPPDSLKVFYKPGIRPWGLPKFLDVEDEPEPEPVDEEVDA